MNAPLEKVLEVKPTEFRLNGVGLTADPHETIIQAAQRHGVEIPHLCYKPGMRTDGNCRACMVEIKGERVLAPSCCRFPTQGMEVASNSPRALHAQKIVVEMLVDPAINMMTTGPDPKATYAYESADPVEALTFNVSGIPMSDLVYPAYFEIFHKPGSVKFDHLDKVNKPFQILSGGYQIVFKNGKWTQIFSSASKKKSFAQEDRRGHRSTIRRLRKRERTSESEIRRRQGHR